MKAVSATFSHNTQRHELGGLIRMSSLTSKLKNTIFELCLKKLYKNSQMVKLSHN